jgi:hypothetical protein
MAHSTKTGTTKQKVDPARLFEFSGNYAALNLNINYPATLTITYIIRIHRYIKARIQLCCMVSSSCWPFISKATPPTFDYTRIV